MKVDPAFCKKIRCVHRVEGAKVSCRCPCGNTCPEGTYNCKDCGHAQEVPKRCPWLLEYLVQA